MNRLERQYQRKLARVAEMREHAYRIQDHDPERAELLRDQAADMLRDANALRDAIEDMPGYIADPAQLHMEALT